MEEIGHIPPQLWGVTGQINLTPGFTASGVIPTIPTPQAKLVYFSMVPPSTGNPGYFSLYLMSGTPHGNIGAPAPAQGNLFVVKSWYFGGGTVNQVLDVSCPIPIGFDTAAGTFWIGGNVTGSFTFFMTVLPEH